MKISYFKNAFADKPASSMSVQEFIEKVRDGEWRKLIDNLRGKDTAGFKKAKAMLPAVTVSGEFKNRDKQVAIEKRLIHHSGFIAIDVDKKDNPKMRANDVVDTEAFAQFVSCSGEGKKIIYRCKPVKTSTEHRRIYDAVIARLEKKGIKLKVDPIVKAINSLQYVSWDPDAFLNTKTKLVVQPLPPIKVVKVKPSANAEKDIAQLNEYIDALGDRDVTSEYENWMLVMFGLSYSLGEAGRGPMHRISANYPGYSKEECDEKYDACLERNVGKVDKPITLASVYQVLHEGMPKVKLKQLAKVYNKGHAIGVGEDEKNEQGDLSGMVRYKLFLFKKIFDKETSALVELEPKKLNLNEFEALLKLKGFFRFQKTFVHINNNIVERVDIGAILNTITDHIEAEGDYKFTYKKVEYSFPWEEMVHLWRELRANSSMTMQITASLKQWEPNLLKDSAEESFVPYLNGVVRVDKKGHGLMPYSKLKQQIWKERILPRNFVENTKRGMFEDFFANVMGRGKTAAEFLKSPSYKRAVWYYGYMLQGSKRQSTARAWMLYDVKSGNNGRSGKTIIGSAVAKIRSVAKIDGKQVDFKNRFAFQTVEPWTDVVFIDDPYKGMQLGPLYNMITGQFIADKKGHAPVVKDVKVMVASNWILEMEGTSETGRQYVSQLSDYYVRYGLENGNTIMPIVHKHGKEFFTDWDERDWAQFDTFSMKAIQYHLNEPAPDSSIGGNAAQIRFIQQFSAEVFLGLSLTFKDALIKSPEGLLIPQQALTGKVKEMIPDTSSNHSGKVVHLYLKAIQFDPMNITTYRLGGSSRMAYRCKKGIKELDFGEWAQSLGIV